VRHDQILETIAARLIRDFAPERIILFGWRARGDQSQGSDYDLIVVMPEGVDRRAMTVAMRRRLADLPGAKDIVVTTAADLARGSRIAGSIADEASRQGVDLYVR
jgi:predicted nucleotidyltransferase